MKSAKFLLFLLVLDAYGADVDAERCLPLSMVAAPGVFGCSRVYHYRDDQGHAHPIKVAYKNVPDAYCGALVLLDERKEQRLVIAPKCKNTQRGVLHTVISCEVHSIASEAVIFSWVEDSEGWLNLFAPAWSNVRWSDNVFGPVPVQWRTPVAVIQNNNPGCCPELLNYGIINTYEDGAEFTRYIYRGADGERLFVCMSVLYKQLCAVGVYWGIESYDGNMTHFGTENAIDRSIIVKFPHVRDNNPRVSYSGGLL